MHLCCCCLRGAPEKDVTTPYVHLGQTEIYSNMLHECFDVQLTPGDGECGICSPCVGRLRDASDFKQLVRRSQAELRTRLQGASRGAERAAIETEEDDDGSIDEQVMFEPEIDLKEEPTCWAAAGEADEDLGEAECLEVGLQRAREAERVTESSDAAMAELQSDSDPEWLLVPDSPSDTRATPAAATPERHASDVTLYECAPCGQKFKHLGELSGHISAAHTKHKKKGPKKAKTPEKSKSDSQTEKRALKRWYCCAICNQECSSPYDLKLHKATHTGAKLYTCESCNRVFRQQSYLAAHKLRCGEKPYACKLCSMKFRTATALQGHSRVHTHKCKVCGKKLGSTAAMKRHKRLHTE